MKFTIKNKILVKNLKKINKLLTKNTNFPILENILIKIEETNLSLTATNLEIELISNIVMEKRYQLEKITVSGQKLLDICRNASEESDITIELNNEKMHVNYENSHYELTTLPSDSFPNHHNFSHFSEFYIPCHALKDMIERTEFSMGQKDVRYYLNGMLIEYKKEILHSVATDGYRLAISKTNLNKKIPEFSVIIPRKGVIELNRLLSIPEQLIRILISNNNIRIYLRNLIFTAQLIEGKYPDYNNVLIEKKENPILINRELLKKSLLRTAILSHEKFCGVEIIIKNGKFIVLSDNQADETAKDFFRIHYFGPAIEISINVYYMLDIINAIKSENIFLLLNQSGSSIQIESDNNPLTLYVVMLLKR
ncbi:DNA polymerase III subunit beta [Buchnera aphidicola (Muscaphis stroyani)]|uniref:Beta sliding clamp n=1 Tax=Buchnera aphidicola (Muscaphis stroyani) TaxID=1241869 RepID=A0A4D6YE65_9GAMM|nr:DNA polymerase III subunit beta [Buchnera aphidicola]QCI24134.1 DNA polymerase III subunit beta [Buchnera aphidicola (Muscaphis stroyani)]